MSIELGVFIIFIFWLFIFLFVLYKDRRNLFLGISFLATILFLALYLMFIVVKYANDYPIIYYIGVIGLMGILFIVTILPLAVVLMFFYNSFMIVRREALRLRNLLSLGTIILLIGYVVWWPSIGRYTYESMTLNGIYIYVTLVVLYFICIGVSYLAASTLNIINLLPRKLDYVVVLGAGLIGERVTPLLASRIRTGIKIYSKHPGSKLIMSGGQGADEVVSEAFAMKNYALEQGVSEEDIIMEDKSTNTEENIKFSKRLMKDVNSRFALVTNYYHVYRALVLAKTLGFRCIGYGAPTKFYFTLNAFIREFIGYLYLKRKIHAIVIVSLTILFILAIAVVEIYYRVNFGGGPALKN